MILLSIKETHAQTLSTVKSWGYQLQDIDPEEVASSPFDLMVIDYTRNGDPSFWFTNHEIRNMKTRPGGDKRILLCYLSIGEAEDYRFYWKQSWKKQKPDWLDKENPDWPGNYKVYYWNDEWKRIVFRYLDKIMQMGFDGVYLDIVDAYEYYNPTHPGSEAEMIQWISEISDYCKQKKGNGFYVIAQNAEGLAQHDNYLNKIDGIAKEELFYGLDNPEEKNTEEEITYSNKYLAKANSTGKKILLVEYLHDSLKISDAQKQASEFGYTIHFSDIGLETLITNPYLQLCKKEHDSLPNKRFTPGMFYSLTVPYKSIRLNFITEYSRERYSYDRTGTDESEISFLSPEYHDLSHKVRAGIGLGKNTEAGIGLPFRYYSMLPDPTDQLWQNRSYGSALGNTELFFCKGYSKNDYRDNLLMEFSVELPTDMRKDILHPGTNNRVGVTAEHFWNTLGIIGYTGINAYTNKQYQGWYVAPELQCGMGAQFQRRLFFSAFIVMEDLVLKSEVSQEYLFTPFFSIELSAGKEFTGVSKGFYASLSLNLIRY